MLNEHDGVKLMNYLFDIKNKLVDLMEQKEIEEAKYNFIFHNEELEGEFIVQLIDEYKIKIHARTKGYLKDKCYKMNSEHGSGKTPPTQKTFETIEFIQSVCRQFYHNDINSQIEYYEKLLNDKIKITQNLFNEILGE